MRARFAQMLPVLLLCARVAGAQSFCALPQGNFSAASSLSQASSALGYSALVNVGLVAGVGASTQAVLGVGLQYASRGAYACFLSNDPPPPIEAVPFSPGTRRNVPSATPLMTVEWTQSFSTLTVTYSVFWATAPVSLQVAGTGLAGMSYTFLGLNWLQTYYWQVTGSDPFGRTAKSGIYRFSISPIVGHLIAAPNPFHPHYNTTTFMFGMQGPGSADVYIYSLPDSRLVFHTTISGLQDGINTWVYDGREDRGGWLPNGVFTARFVERGANGTTEERFKIVSIR